MKSHQKIIPYLWFDTQALDAAEFYTHLFKASRIGTVSKYAKKGQEIHGRPEGSVMTVEFELSGYRFFALNGGPHFEINPSISFFVVCETEDEIDLLWKNLSEDGKTLMPLDRYAWSERYGWIQDRFNVSWQLFLGETEDAGQKITPCLMFTGNQCGKAETAINQYTQIFNNSSIDLIARYDGTEPGGDRAGTIKHAQFALNGEHFRAMDSAMDPSFHFNEAVSFFVECENQEEIDYFWENLTKGGDPNARQCGWLKDTFGVSWQVCPKVLSKMLLDQVPEKVARVTQAFLQMKKFDLSKIYKAYNNE